MHKLKQFFSLLILIPGIVIPVYSQDASDLTAQLSERYVSLQTMKADFVQSATSEFLDSPERFSGSLTFSGSGYRIETGSQTIVTDGETTWIYNRTQNQVIINDFFEDEYSFSLTTFLQQLDRDYSASSSGVENRSGSTHDMLDLKPKDEFAAFRSVRLAVRRSDLLVTWLKVIDLNDVEMVFDLTNIQVDPKLPEDVFRFVPADDVDVVDLRG